MKQFVFCFSLFLLFVPASICVAGPNRVLVVANAASQTSTAIARYYCKKRHIPSINLCVISCPLDETCSTVEAEATIFSPVRLYIRKNKLKIDYIVLTKDIPIRFSAGTWKDCSIDSVMVELDDPLGQRANNPYFAATDRFSHAEYGIYLVTRLTGWSLQDAITLINSGQATKAGKGPIYLHPAIDKDVDGYAMTNQAIRIAWAELQTAGFNVDLDSSANFHRPSGLLAGYYTWGSNDPNFDIGIYRSLAFSPGSIAETVVSTSARTFADPDAPGQSLIADLIHEGVAGCKGYVSEPYVSSMACADILFDRYTGGWNLADSFYAASRTVCWKDMVIGDPLCAPYSNVR